MYYLAVILFIIVFTFIYGSMSGYSVHWILHKKIFAKLAKGHDTHHKLYTISDFESETYRDAKLHNSAFVFIPIITAAIALACVALWAILHVWWIYPLILAEGIFIGWLNDYVHYAIHIKGHWLNKYSFFKRLKDLHWLHHKYPEKNHGIIWFGLDKAFGTFTNVQDSI